VTEGANFLHKKTDDRSCYFCFFPEPFQQIYLSIKYRCAWG